MHCDNAQCGGEELLEVVVFTCRVCGRSHTRVDIDLEGDSEFESDDSED